MIEEIYIAKKRGSPQQRKHEVEVRSDLGIVGDRNFGKKVHPGQNVTFIEREEIDSYNAKYNQCIPLESTRRNIITKGVRLNDLVGKVFCVGNATFKGVELCEPCKFLGDQLANQGMSPAQVVKAFVSKGGLRADVLSDGVISIGMDLEFNT